MIHSRWSNGPRHATPIDNFLRFHEETYSLTWCYSSAPGRRRDCFRSATCRLPVSRLRTADAEGRVARRAGGGGLAASSSRSNAAAQAAARLRNWDRELADEAVIVGPAEASTLSRTVELRPARSTSIVMVTAVSDVFACWPPGPPDRVAIHDTASAEMRKPRGVRYTPSTGSTDPLCQSSDGVAANRKRD